MGAAAKICIFRPVPSKMELPLFVSQVAAGFPSPADDFIEKKLDLNEHLIEHPAATFFIRVTGDSMQQAGIFAGDLVVIDRSQEPKNGNVVLAVVNGEFTLKRLVTEGTKIILRPANPLYQD